MLKSNTAINVWIEKEKIYSGIEMIVHQIIQWLPGLW